MSIDVWRDCFSKVNGKSQRDSCLVNKVDWEAVPKFPFQFTRVDTCIVMNKAEASKIGCRFAFLMFYLFIFERTLFL